VLSRRKKKGEGAKTEVSGGENDWRGKSIVRGEGGPAVKCFVMLKGRYVLGKRN